MNARARNITDVTSSGGAVINFPGSRTTTTREGVSSENIWSIMIDRPDLEAKFRRIVEAAVIDAYLKMRLNEPTQQDDPFDPVYISELKMDLVYTPSFETLKRYSTIVDRSEWLELKDDLED